MGPVPALIRAGAQSCLTERPTVTPVAVVATLTKVLIMQVLPLPMVQPDEAQPLESSSVALTWFVNQLFDRTVYAPVAACPVSAKKVVFEGSDE